MSRSLAEIEFAKKLKNEIGEEFFCNARNLPGTPDIVFKNHKMVIFFNGCYWHSHHCRTVAKTFVWAEILSEIKNNDSQVISKLKNLGYETIVVWECEWNSRPRDIISYIKGRLYFARCPLKTSNKPLKAQVQ